MGQVEVLRDVEMRVARLNDLSFRHFGLSSASDCIDFNFESGVNLHTPDGSGGGQLWQVPRVHAIEHVVLNAVINVGVNLDDLVKRGTCGFKHEFKIFEDALGLTRHAAV